MRILHVIPALDPNTGGPSNAVPRLAAAQRRLGAEAEILTYRFVGREKRTETELAQSPASDVPVHWVNFNYQREWLFTPAARQTLGRLVPSQDVVVIHNVWDPICLAAARAARKAAVPYVVVPHGGLDPWTMSQRPLRKRIGLALGYRRMLQQAAFLQMLNEDERKLIEPLRLNVRTEIVPNGVFLEEMEPLPARGEFRQSLASLQDQPFILFLGRLHQMKGLDVLAEAFERLAATRHDVDLVIAGPDDGAGSELADRVARSGVQQRVHVIGPIYGRAKLAAMVDASVFCLPSRREGFSIAVLEAMACGCPVVLSEQCHFPEVAAAGAGHVVPLAAPAVARALESVLSDAAAREMGNRGAMLVRERFTWQHAAQTSLDRYADLRRSD